MRGESLVKEFIEGRMEGKRGRKKPRIMIIADFKANESYENIKRRAIDRECWRNWMPRTCFLPLSLLLRALSCRVEGETKFFVNMSLLALLVEEMV